MVYQTHNLYHIKYEISNKTMAFYYIGEADAYESEENISHTSSSPIELVSEEPSITPIIGIEQ